MMKKCGHGYVSRDVGLEEKFWDDLASAMDAPFEGEEFRKAVGEIALVVEESLPEDVEDGQAVCDTCYRHAVHALQSLGVLVRAYAEAHTPHEHDEQQEMAFEPRPRDDEGKHAGEPEQAFDLATDEQVQALHALFKTAGLTSEQRVAFASEFAGRQIGMLAHLGREEADTLSTRIEAILKGEGVSDG